MQNQDDRINLLRLINEHKLSPDNAMAVLHGKIKLEDELDRKRTKSRASELQEMHARDWPKPRVKWDLSPKSRHLALDGVSREGFDEAYPDTQLVWVNCEELHSNLNDSSKRRAGPLSKKYKARTAGAVAHLELGGAVTPPLIVIWGNLLHIAGGNHHLGWAKRMKQSPVPILIRAAEHNQIEQLLVLRENPDGLEAMP